MVKRMSGCKKCRKIGIKLCGKGPKCVLERRAVSPGQHGKRVGTKKTSEFGRQLQEKQKLKLMYGMREKQFVRFFHIASAQKGITGELLLSALERRLDNVIYRLKMATSRIQSRQMIVHGHVNVDGRRVTAPSFLVKEGSVITLSDRALKKSVFLEAVVDKRLNMGIRVPEWLELQKKERKGIVLRLPVKSDIAVQIEEHLVVELYSK